MAKNFKKGDKVKLPYVFTSNDVLKIVVETVNDVTGLVTEVKLIKADGKFEIMEVNNVIVISANIIFRIISFFERLFRKR
jgi:hypothetical protein